MTNFESKIIVAPTVDDLVQNGVRHIQDDGEAFEAHAGSGLQAYGTSYVLENSLARVHTLRAPESKTYLAQELYAYFVGSLNVEDGLAQATPFWRSLCDTDGTINSNYGYYVFRQLTSDGHTQLDWVRECFLRNQDSRKAFIGINGLEHKTDTRDFPCTIGMQFNIRNGQMNCNVASRSTDVITGLPYDMGFFSLVNELVAGVVSFDLGEEIKPGYTAMHTTFTQIYDKTRAKADQVLHSFATKSEQHMPAIDQPIETLNDILNIQGRAPTTESVKWVCKYAGVVTE